MSHISYLLSQINFKQMINQNFNIQRFIRYSVNNFRQYGNLYLTFIVGLFFGLLLFTSLSMYNEHVWNNNDWQRIFITSAIFVGVMVIGTSFPYLRKKERTMNFLMLPASNLEKYSFEVLLRMVALSIVFPIVLNVTSILAIHLVDYAHYLLGSHGEAFSCESLSFAKVLDARKPGITTLLFGSAFFGFSLPFAGSVVFTKRPFIMTLVFVAGVIAVGVGYMYILMEKIHIKRPIIADFLEWMGEEKGMAFLFWLIVLLSVWVLTYAFFKLKEKEV